MCIVIDSNAIHLVFKLQDSDFRPVYNWIFNGDGKMVFGGTRYAKELIKLRKYSKIITELSRNNKVVVVNKDSVDSWEAKVKKIEPKKDFNDPHLVAIIEESGCRIVCSLDKSSDKYLKDNRFYKKTKRPGIYREKGHSHLLSNKNIVAICR